MKRKRNEIRPGESENKKQRIEESLEKETVKDNGENEVETSNLHQWAVSTNCYAEWVESIAKVFK